jgi:hypothetical protein
MYRARVLIDAIDKWVSDKNIPTETLNSTKIKQIMKKICTQYNSQSIFDSSAVNEFNTIIDYFATKFSFGWRKKKTLQNFQIKKVYQNITRQKIPLGTTYGNMIYVNPTETLIVYNTDGQYIRFLMNGRKMKLKKDKWRARVRNNELKFIDEIITQDITI